MGLKCLIIDDDPMICDLVKYFCTKIKEIEYDEFIGRPSEKIKSIRRRLV